MIHASNNLIICIEKNKRKRKIMYKKKRGKRANKKKGTKCPKVNVENNAYELYLKLECMNMWKTWLMDS